MPKELKVALLEGAQGLKLKDTLKLYHKYNIRYVDCQENTTGSCNRNFCEKIWRCNSPNIPTPLPPATPSREYFSWKFKKLYSGRSEERGEVCYTYPVPHCSNPL